MMTNRLFREKWKSGKSGDTTLISFLKVNWCDASHPTCYDAFFIVIGAQDSVSFRSKVQGSY